MTLLMKTEPCVLMVHDGDRVKVVAIDDDAEIPKHEVLILP
jgi:hypothetical protein